MGGILAKLLDMAVSPADITNQCPSSPSGPEQKPSPTQRGPHILSGSGRGHRAWRSSAGALLSPTGPSLCPHRFNSEEVCTCPQASVPQQFAAVPWNSFSRDVLAALYGFAPISVHCNKSSAVRFQVHPCVRTWGCRDQASLPQPQPCCHPLCRRWRASTRGEG